MRHRFTGSMAALVVVLAFSQIMLAQTSEQTGMAKAPAPTPALSHDLSGIWMPYPGEMNGVNEKSRPALTPWGQARFDAAVPQVGPRAVPGKENDPHFRCIPDGPPKLLIHPNPFEIVQTPDRFLMFFEEHRIWRTTWTDGRALPKDPDPTFLGYSVGKWQGDAFVVESIGFNDRVWVDSYGNPRSDQMHLTERYRRLNHDTLELTITMDDPKAYTKTWVNPPKLFKLEPAWEIGEFFCVIDEENAYGEAVRKPAGGGSPVQ